MSAAWPRLQNPEWSGESEEFHSRGLEVLVNRLRGQNKARILDLAPALGSTVTYLGQYACKVYIEDFYDSLSNLPRREEDDGELPLAEFIKLFAHGVDDRFDIILGWDVLGHLDEAIIKLLMQHLRFHSHPGTLLYILVPTQSQMSATPARFSIKPDNRVLYVPGTRTKPNPGYTTRTLERMMKGFVMLHSFMLRNGLQEYVFSRT
jgi:2-polyprenyl-3-methyl-5-hydroxy-6-metoxy-1,4-benzoquinol methylase